MLQAIRIITLTALTSLCGHTALAADNPLSVHILDLQTSQPTAGVGVDLEQRTASGWRPMASGVTDHNGRIRALFPEGQSLVSGEYRVVFRTGEHYARVRQSTFFPEIPVPFKVESAAQHYHIPLLLSPYGYSTYRGN